MNEEKILHGVIEDRWVPPCEDSSLKGLNEQLSDNFDPYNDEDVSLFFLNFFVFTQAGQRKPVL